MMRYFIYSLISLTTILCGAIYWLGFTVSGAAYLVDFIDSQTEDVSIGTVRGTLADRLHLGHIRLAAETINIEASDANIQIDPFALLLLRLNLYELEIGELQISLPETADQTHADGGAVRVPVAINLMNATIHKLGIRTATFSHDLRDLRFAASVSANALRVTRFTASDETFTLTTEMDLLPAPPWTLTSTYHVQTHSPAGVNGRRLSVRGRFHGDIDKITLAGLMDAPQRIRYRGEISNLDGTPTGDVSLSADQLDLEPFLSQPGQLTGASLEISGWLAHYEFTASGNAILPDLPPLSYALKGAGDTEVIDLARALVRLDEATASFEGRINLADGAVSGRIQTRGIPLTLAHEELEGMLDAQGSIAWRQDSGAIIDLERIYGSLFTREITGRLRITGTSVDDITIDGLLRSGSNELTLNTGTHAGELSFSLDAPDVHALYPSLQGQLQATGRVNTRPPISAAVQLQARQVPLGAFDPALTGDINFDADAEWGQAHGYRVQLTNVAGSLFERAVSGRADLTGTDLADIRGKGELRVGENQLRIEGDLARRAFDFNVSAPALSALYPDLGGDLRAAGNIRLQPDEPVIKLQARSNNLTFAGHRIEGFHIDIPEPADSAVRTASAGWSDWQYGQWTMGGLEANYDGTLEAGRLGLLWQHPDANAEVTVSLRRNENDILGQLHSGTVNVSESTWRSDQDVPFRGSAMPASFQISPHCWRHGEASICLPKLDVRHDSASFEADLQRIPVEFDNIGATLGNPNIPDNLSVKTLVDFKLSARWQDSMIDAGFEAALPNTELGWSDEEAPLVISFVSRGEIQNNKLDMALESTNDAGHEFRGRLSIPDLQHPDKGEAEIELNGNYVPIVTALVPQLSQGEGGMIANLRARTTESPPSLTGRIQVPAGASVAIPAAGIRVSDIELVAETGHNGLVHLRGGATSGEGSVTMAGKISMPLSEDQEIHLSLSGENFQTMNTRDLKLVTSPDLTLEQSAGSMRVTGEVTLVDGAIRYAELDTESRTISSDVRIDDGDEDAPPLTRTEVDLRVNLMNKVHIKGYGLDANIGGTLDLDQGPDSPPRAHGVLTLYNGKISRFGQTLSIDRGRLIYTGPLTNPTVDVVTSRTIRSANGNVKVILTLSGSANNIRSNISAEPAMSEANALSWLLLGRPLMSASNEDGQGLAGAALSLGLHQALPITKEIGSTLGLDELDVSADSTDSASILAGKRINEDLYVQYNYDVFSKIGGILFKYSLTPRVSVEAQSGESKSLELIYTF